LFRPRTAMRSRCCDRPRSRGREALASVRPEVLAEASRVRARRFETLVVPAEPRRRAARRQARSRRTVRTLSVLRSSSSAPEAAVLRSKEDAHVLRQQLVLVEDELPARDLPRAVDAPQDVLARTHVQVLLALRPCS